MDRGGTREEHRGERICLHARNLAIEAYDQHFCPFTSLSVCIAPVYVCSVEFSPLTSGYNAGFIALSGHQTPQACWISTRQIREHESALSSGPLAPGFANMYFTSAMSSFEDFSQLEGVDCPCRWCRHPSILSQLNMRPNGQLQAVASLARLPNSLQGFPVHDHHNT